MQIVMMKYLFSLASVAVAVAQAVTPLPTAQVYIFDRAAAEPSAPTISRDAARLVLSHRLRETPDESGPYVSSLIQPTSLDKYIQSYGKPRQSLFSTQRDRRERQLVVFVEGTLTETTDELQNALDGVSPSFSIIQPPSYQANTNLLRNDFADFTTECTLDMILNNDGDNTCWDNGDSLVIKSDISKVPDFAGNLAALVPHFISWGQSGELETTLVLIPEASRIDGDDTWSIGSRVERRQESETVMKFEAQASNDVQLSVPAAEAMATPSPMDAFSPGGLCYDSRSKCMNDTFGCFRHGDCVDISGCWRCQCNPTVDSSSHITTYWTGSSCQKADISTEFWMFAGVGLLIILSVGGALSLLVSVGNEPLPGVLGAGVVRSK